jgi:transcriptional regulator with XRE-family HTH domain
MTEPGEPDPQMRQLGGYIKVQRQLAELSLRRLADMTQVSNAYLSQIERGLHQPSLRVLRSIAEALNVSAETLLAQAGVQPGSTTTGAEGPPPAGTEAAIRADPDLTAEEQETLVTIYRSFIRGKAPTGPETTD